MKVKLVSVPVLDQEKALAFYTEKLLFVKKHDVPLGENHRWLTVVAPDALEGSNQHPFHSNLPKHIRRRCLKQVFRGLKLMLKTVNKNTIDW